MEADKGIYLDHVNATPLLPEVVEALQVDLLSLAANSFYGPKGALRAGRKRRALAGAPTATSRRPAIRLSARAVGPS